jgi:hypothetical protein
MMSVEEFQKPTCKKCQKELDFLYQLPWFCFECELKVEGYIRNGVAAVILLTTFFLFILANPSFTKGYDQYVQERKEWCRNEIMGLYEDTGPPKSAEFHQSILKGCQTRAESDASIGIGPILVGIVLTILWYLFSFHSLFNIAPLNKRSERTRIKYEDAYVKYINAVNKGKGKKHKVLTRSESKEKKRREIEEKKKKADKAKGIGKTGREVLNSKGKASYGYIEDMGDDDADMFIFCRVNVLDIIEREHLSKGDYLTWFNRMGETYSNDYSKYKEKYSKKEVIDQIQWALSHLSKVYTGKSASTGKKREEKLLTTIKRIESL